MIVLCHDIYTKLDRYVMVSGPTDRRTEFPGFEYMDLPNPFPLVYDPNSDDYTRACRVCVDFWNGSHANRTRLWPQWERHLKTTHNPKTSHKGNGKPQGAFAFTLTASPKDGLDEFAMIKAARKVMNQKSCPVYKYAWFLEYGKENGLPHIHGMYETNDGHRIEAKHFKRAWQIWDEKKQQGAGFRGGYHRPVRSEEHYTDYIKKDQGKSESKNVDLEDEYSIQADEEV